MDFLEILQQASHNAQKATKVVKNLDREAQEQRIKRRQQYERELLREREEKKLKAPPKVEKKFVIPKKKNPNESVDPKAIQCFMERQRNNQIQKDIQKKKERDKLIGLRLQANQGKASKKIASQFGKTAIELQQRYAPNSHMEMELLKRQEREQEEIAKTGSALRESIEKAKRDRATILARSVMRPKEKTRIGNVRPGGFADMTSKQEAILTKRKAENFITFASTREKAKRPKIASSNGISAKVDFHTLMAQAKQNTDVKNVAVKTEQLIRSSQQNVSSQTSSREVMKRAMIEEVSRKKAAVNISKVLPPQTQSISSNRFNTKVKPVIKNPYALSDRQVLGPSMSSTQKKPNRGDRPLPPIPQAPTKKEPRILPGDLRYKGPAPSKQQKKSELIKEKRTVSPSRTLSTSFKRPLSPISKKAKLRPYSNPAMFGKRNGQSSSYISGYNYSDESNQEDEEDEYDTDLEDFIDDSEVHELEVADLEESLKSINRNYDKRKWAMREKMISESNMVAGFRDIEAEEKRSSKLALIEDLLEAKKGSKGIA